MRWLNIGFHVFWNMEANVCISHICVRLHMCLFICGVFVWVGAHACVCAHVCEPAETAARAHLPARGTIRGTARRWQDYSETVASRLHSATRKVCVCDRERHSFLQYLCWSACVISFFLQEQQWAASSHSVSFRGVEIIVISKLVILNSYLFETLRHLFSCLSLINNQINNTELYMNRCILCIVWGQYVC